MQEVLRLVPLFADLEDADLERLCELLVERRLVDDEVLFREGDLGDKAYIIKSGQLEIIKEAGGREVLLARRKRGEVIGEMSLLEDAPRMASVRARGGTILLEVDKAVINDLVRTSGSAARAMFHTILARSRATSTMLRQSEKMAQLGTLTAGVAHELNNPATAVQRGASQLEEAIAAYGSACALVEPFRDVAVVAAALERLDEAVRGSAGKPDDFDALERSDRETDVEDWLDDNEVDDGSDLAPGLVTVGLVPDALDDLATELGDATQPVLSWVARAIETFSLIAEIGEGASRVSGIVRALKSYAYLDQAPTQDVDVHQGLDDTLVLLRGKLKGGLRVVREYADDLPLISAFGSELNQVWTNLLDNAAYATGGDGTITIRTSYREGFVVVEIEDDGAGMTPEVRDRVFDAFFTTKPPGEGTGLGLDISYRIIAHKHDGDIKVMSKPGETCFQVWLPADEGAAVAAIPQSSDSLLEAILLESKTIAVSGISNNPDRPTHTVPKYLQDAGYQIIPVNPHLDAVLDVPSIATLAAAEVPIDVVLAFRRPEHMPAVVAEAIAVGASTVWMQEGIVNEDAAAIAREAGLRVVMDLCMRSTHRRLLGN